VVKLDPQGKFLWASIQTDTGTQDVGGISVNGAGESCVAGAHRGTSTFGTTTLTSTASPNIKDLYVAKLDASGGFQWATQGGGALEDTGLAVGQDSSGGCTVTGRYTPPATFGTTTLSSGTKDAYIARLDASGAFDWATAASSGMSEGNDLALDSSGGPCVFGWYIGSMSLGSTTLVSKETELFVASADSAGKLLWGIATKPTSTSGSYLVAAGIAVGPSGDLFAGGVFKGDYIFGSKLLSSSSAITTAVFVWKIAPASGPAGG
jgi:hypothetical protein